ncbi:MAG: transcription termination/antitermination protein NusA [Candidatus Pacebacteria bacterium]|nr:transcription termination/antitermination protein NusA [Candidatus Paceibacterota bacterium]
MDLKVVNAVMAQLEEEKGITKDVVIDAIELALANAYRKEYGKKGQIVRAKFDLNSGSVEFNQVRIVVDRDSVLMDEEEVSTPKEGEEEKVHFNSEHHILLEDAKLMKTGAKIGDELVFPLEKKEDFGRIAAQTAKQVIMQKIREAEKTSVISEFGQREGEIISGTVERMERGSVYLDMGRAVGLLPYEEQIPGERFKQGERVRAYLFKVDETSRGVFLKLSRSHPKFLQELFSAEVPELAQGIVEVKSIAREAGSRSKIAVISNDDHVDPVGALVGQRGVRVSTIMSELGGEKIDIIEWSEDPAKFVEEALSPAHILDIQITETEESRIAKVLVAPDQQSLAIGKGGQNVRLAAKLTGWKIDIASIEVPEEAKEEVKLEE